MSTSVYKYRAICIEEAIYVYQWGTIPPTLCPNVHADRTLDTSSITVVETVASTDVTAKEQSDGYYQSKSFYLSIPAGVTGAMSTQTVSWPVDILLWLTEVYVGPGADSDMFEIIGSPDTIIGVCTAAVTAGDTVIYVSPTVIQNISFGLNVNIFDGVNNDVVGVVTAIDADASTITIEIPPTHSFAIGSYIILNVYVIREHIIYGSDSCGYRTSFGEKGFKGKPVAANVELKFNYYNNTTTAKVVAIKTEYYISEWINPNIAP